MTGAASEGATPALRLSIAGWGMAVPDRVVTNDDWAQLVDTNDAWIVERTGIRERRAAAEGETTASLAIAAGAAAIKQADLTPSDIGTCIVATCTPEQPIPATGTFVQEGLGLQCGAFDVDAACAGFVYALVVGASMLVTGGMRAALVIGSETLTRYADPLDRSTCVLFGDGAGALVLVPGSESGLLAWDMGCDGSAANLLAVPAGGSRMPTSIATVENRLHYLKMGGQEVFRRAVRAVVDSGLTTLAKAGVSPRDVNLFVPHQANIRIIEAAASRLGIPMERAFVNIDRYGNTSAASIPIALTEAAQQGHLHDGDLVLVAGFGAGMSWASALIRWGRD